MNEDVGAVSWSVGVEPPLLGEFEAAVSGFGPDGRPVRVSQSPIIARNEVKGYAAGWIGDGRVLEALRKECRGAASRWNGAGRTLRRL